MLIIFNLLYLHCWTCLWHLFHKTWLTLAKALGFVWHASNPKCNKALVSVWERESQILRQFNSSILLKSFAVYTDGECEGKVFRYLWKLWLMLRCNCLPFCFASSSSSSSATTSPSASERHSCDHLSSRNYYRSEESVLSISATFSIWIQWCGA